MPAGLGKSVPEYRRCQPHAMSTPGNSGDVYGGTTPICYKFNSAQYPYLLPQRLASLSENPLTVYRKMSGNKPAALSN